MSSFDPSKIKLPPVPEPQFDDDRDDIELPDQPRAETSTGDGQPAPTTDAGDDAGGDDGGSQEQLLEQILSELQLMNTNLEQIGDVGTLG